MALFNVVQEVVQTQRPWDSASKYLLCYVTVILFTYPPAVSKKNIKNLIKTLMDHIRFLAPWNWPQRCGDHTPLNLPQCLWVWSPFHLFANWGTVLGRFVPSHFCGASWELMQLKAAVYTWRQFWKISAKESCNVRTPGDIKREVEQC